MTKPSADSSRLSTRTQSSCPIRAQQSSQTLFSIPCLPVPVTIPEVPVIVSSNDHHAKTQLNPSESIFSKLSYDINEVGERSKKPCPQLTSQKGDLTAGCGDIFDDEFEINLHTPNQSETFFNDDDIAFCPVFDRPCSKIFQLGSVQSIEPKMKDASYSKSRSMQTIEVKTEGICKNDSESVHTIELNMNNASPMENGGRCPIKSIVLNMKKLFSLVSPCESEPALSLEKSLDSKTSTTTLQKEEEIPKNYNTIVSTFAANYSDSSSLCKESCELFRSAKSIAVENIDEIKTSMHEKVPLTAVVSNQKQSSSISERNKETDVIKAVTVKQTNENSSSEKVQMAKINKSHAPENITKGIHGMHSTIGRNNSKSKESDDHPRAITQKLTQDCSKIEKILSKYQLSPKTVVKEKVLDNTTSNCSCKTVESVMQDLCQTIRNCAPGVVEPKQVISFLECVADLGVNYKKIGRKASRETTAATENVSINFREASPDNKCPISSTLEQQFFECFGYNESNIQYAHHKCILKDFFDEFRKKLDALHRNLASESLSCAQLVKDKNIANYSK